MLDIGSGTGVLAIEALRRWPAIEVVGVDPSSEMLERARGEADERLAGDVRRRFSTQTAFAAELPFADASFDVAVSSFVLQLVPSRIAALQAARRVLRRGGKIAWASWLVGGERFRPDEVVNDVLDDFGFDPPEPEGRSGDPASVAAAIASTRRAGFRSVAGRRDELRHAWTPESYLAFFSEFDEASLFDELEPGERSEIEAAMLEGLRALPPEDLVMRLPVVYVTGTVPT
jgi:SAM-dependent methyltransferase